MFFFQEGVVTGKRFGAARREAKGGRGDKKLGEKVGLLCNVVQCHM